MGIEYQLRFAAPDPGAVDELFRRRFPSARAATPPQAGFDLRVGTSEGENPQATMQTEPGGLYFCDYCGGHGRALLGEVVASVFGPITGEEL
jgi:hypothetical protein